MDVVQDWILAFSYAFFFFSDAAPTVIYTLSLHDALPICPAWEPRFFVFPGPGDAVRVGVAALEAEAFLVWPRLELRRLARKLGLARARRHLRRVLPARPASRPASPQPGRSPAAR